MARESVVESGRACDTCGASLAGRFKLARFCDRNCSVAYARAELSCPVCEGPRSRSRKTCGQRECVQIQNMGAPKLIGADCAHCGARCKPKARADHAGRKYCSMTCRMAQKLEECTKSCETCAKTFVGKFHDSRFCSRECFSESKRPGAAFARVAPDELSGKCGHCKADVYGRRHTLDENGDPLDNVYCGRECYAAQKRILYGGVKWRSFRGHEWRKIKVQIRARDKHTCQRCGVTEHGAGRAHDVHHRIPFWQFQGDNARANRPSNLTLLCKPCHAVVEREWRQENSVQLVMMLPPQECRTST